MSYLSDKLIDIINQKDVEDSKLTSAFIICLYQCQILIGYNNWRKQWEVPAGKREQGESIIQTAKREFLEETHHHVSKIKLERVAIIQDDCFKLRYRAIFIAEIDTFVEFEKLKDDEMDKLLLVNFSDLKKLDMDKLDLEILESLIDSKEISNEY